MRFTTSLRRIVSISGVVVLAMIFAPTAQAQESVFIDSDNVQAGSSTPYFVGGDYAWGVDKAVLPFDPTTAGEEATFVFAWGDGTSYTTTSASNDVNCYFDENYGASVCGSFAGHRYTAQGHFVITLTVSQPGSTSASVTGEAVVYDLAAGGSVKGSGTLLARNGGMYDQQFAENPAPATFNLTAKRRSGTAATTVALTVDVPSMLPDYPADGTYHGMTFTGTAATQPLYVQPGTTRGSYDLYLERVYGTVTNSGGDAGTASATVRASIAKGQVTRLRIWVQNTSAGYTYVDTGTDGQSLWDLSSSNVLLTGSLKVG